MRIPIQPTLDLLLKQEDTDGDKKITIEDEGPKRFIIDEGDQQMVIEGTYKLSILLQELVLAHSSGEAFVTIDEALFEESPRNRISRMIRDHYWDALTRKMDETGIDLLIADTKNQDLESDFLRVYVPYNDLLAQSYYTHLAKQKPIEVKVLPENITARYVQSINTKAGILSLKLMKNDDAIKASPFVVPGGRFNEMYGWDSYFQNLGLLIDGKLDLARSVVDNFQYEIDHYGKILNANRSYYLTRTQPPFYSSMIRDVFRQSKDKIWLASHLKTAIKEYHHVWMEKDKRLLSCGLNRFLAEGIGITPESEESHYDTILAPYADLANMNLVDFRKAFVQGDIHVDELDDYFIHDRTVRESGHDTSYRLEGICADLALVELNCMLYKYEVDFAELIKSEFQDDFEGFNSDYWFMRAEERKTKMNALMWSDQDGIYYDYNHKHNKQHSFLAATCFFPLWVGIATPEQAAQMIQLHLLHLIEKGGLAGCTKEARGPINKSRPQRQWDYPNGWAPHQIIIWKGLIQYGYIDLAKDLINRWLDMITTNAMNYNGTIPEKYDVVEATHKVFAEYGNVGTDFEYITKEGFGWMNASFQVGMDLLRRFT